MEFDKESRLNAAWARLRTMLEPAWVLGQGASGSAPPSSEERRGLPPRSPLHAAASHQSMISTDVVRVDCEVVTAVGVYSGESAMDGH